VCERRKSINLRCPSGASLWEVCAPVRRWSHREYDGGARKSATWMLPRSALLSHDMTALLLWERGAETGEVMGKEAIQPVKKNRY